MRRSWLSSSAQDRQTSAPIRIRKWRCPARSAPKVLPTSILFDASGKEVWRYVGDLDWTSAEAAKLLSEAGAPPTG